MKTPILEQVYGATTPVEQESAYDAWSASYERDLFAMGYRAPWITAAVFARHVHPAAGPVLDAGCGGGLQGEALALLGYGPITGIDLSDGMLSVARAKGIYADLRKMALGGGLDLPRGHFAAVISVGTITQGHAPPSSFADLVAVTRAGGHIVFALRDDPSIDPAYAAACAALERDGLWRPVFVSERFQAMPYSEPSVTLRAAVYEVA